MCIIAVYSKGLRPTKERIEQMMGTNKDGVGIGYNTGRGAYFVKGFTTVEGVMKFVKQLDFAKDIVFHARIATSGGISAEKCHPFPISSDNDVLNKTSGKGGAPVIFHNGIFSIDIEKGLNDTQTFIKRVVAPLWRLDKRGFIAGDYDEVLRMASRGSRLAILFPDGVRVFGEWTTDDGGVLYSNTGYKPYTYYGRVWDRDEFDSWDDYAETWRTRRNNARGVTTYGRTNK